MEVTNKELLAIEECLNALSKISGSPAFKYGVARNLSGLKPLSEALAVARNGDDIPNVKEYFLARRDILQDCADDPAERDRQIAKLDASMPETVDELYKRDQAYGDLLKAKVLVPVFKLKLEKFPESLSVDITPILGYIEE